MSAARDYVKAALGPLEQLTPPMSVIPYARDLSRPTRSTVMLRIDTVEPRHEVQPGARRYTFGLLVVGFLLNPGQNAEDELDGALEDVLAVIDADNTLTWTRAERATFDDKFPAYEVTVTVNIKPETGA